MVLTVVVLTLLAAFVIYLIRLWLINRVQPRRIYVRPLTPKWDTERTMSEMIDKSRWEADLAELTRRAGGPQRK